MTFRPHHGITLVDNSWIENLHVERLAADPVPLVAGRVWYNETDKVLRFSSLDDLGAVTVIDVPSQAELTLVHDLVDVINSDSTVEGSFRKAIADVVAAAPEALDTLQEIATAMNNDPDLYNTLVNLVNTSISDLNDQILGTATTAMDTLGEVQTAIGDPTTLATVATDVTAAINELKTNQDAIETGAGLATDGTYVVKGSANYISTATSLATADDALDAALKVEETARVDGDAALQTELDATQTSIGASVDADGTYVPRTGSNYIDGQATISAEISALDAAVKSVADNGGSATTALQTELDATQTGVGTAADGTHVARAGTNYLDSATSIAGEITLLDTAVQGVQDELDVTQTGAGLNADGTFTANATANYTSGATSLMDATNVLDTALKTEEDRAIAAEAAIQAELDASQAGAGLDADGNFVANATANYTSGATSLMDATDVLDTALKAEEDARIAADAALQAELDATQVGAGLGEDGGYTANGTANYISTSTSLVSADEDLDAALKAEETARIAQDDAIEAGVGLQADGSYANNGEYAAGTNETGHFYIGLDTTVAGALVSLDTGLKAEVDARAAADGDLTALTTTDKTNLVAAINEVVVLAGDGTDALKTAINAKKAIYTAGAAATNHVFNHGLAGADLDVTVWVWDATASKWYNDSVLVEVDPATTTVTVPLQVAKIIKIIVEDISDIA